MPVTGDVIDEQGRALHPRPRRRGGDYLGGDANVAPRVGEAAKAGECSYPTAPPPSSTR